MKLGSFDMVARLVEARRVLMTRREGGLIKIYIDGFVQDQEMTERARPHIRAELQRRIDEIDEDLRALGVDPD